MATQAEIREQALRHARQLEAVLWLSVNDLAVRWAVSSATVRKIPRTDLPYLTLGMTAQRRYSPDDVLAYEERQKGLGG